jgi:hypothetical protein
MNFVQQSSAKPLRFWDMSSLRKFAANIAAAILEKKAGILGILRLARAGNALH